MNPPSSQPGRHILGGTIRIFLAEAMLLPTSLLTAAFLTRQLGPEGYGLFVLVTTLVAWIQWSIVSIFSRSTVKFIGEAEDWKPVGATIVQMHLLVGGVAALLLFLLATPIARLLKEPVLAPYLQLFALDIPLFCLGYAHRSILVGIGGFSQRASITAARWIARLVLIVLLVELGLSVQGALLGSIGASVVELVISLFYICLPLFSKSTFPARKLWDYGVPLFLFALSMRLYDKLDLFALKTLGGTVAQAGIYGAAQNLSVVPGLFALSFSPILLSTLTRTLCVGEFQLARKMGRDAMRLVIGLLPFAGMAAGAAPELVSLIFGPAFLPAAPILAWLIFGAIALVMISVTTAILTAAGKPGWTFALSGPLVPLAIGGHLLVIPKLGTIGASLVSTVFAGLGALAAVLSVYRLWQILPPLTTLVRSVLVCGLAYTLAVLWPTPGFLVLLKLLVIGLLIPLTFLLLGEFSTSEIAVIRSMVRRQTVPKEKPQNPRKF